MAKEITDTIDEFCSYFEKQVEIIKAIQIKPDALDVLNLMPEDYQTRLYKKILYVTEIDALAGIRFHKSTYPDFNSKNRERFVRFIKEYGDWPKGELVSLPFVFDELNKSKSKDSNLFNHIYHKLTCSKSIEGEPVGYESFDENINDLLKLASTEKEEKALFRYQHYSIFYRYRNYLVHDSREPGHAMEGVFSSTDPHYHKYIDEERWYLIYPIDLFETIFKKSIETVKQYFKGNKMNPYNFVEDTSRW